MTDSPNKQEPNEKATPEDLQAHISDLLADSLPVEGGESDPGNLKADPGKGEDGLPLKEEEPKPADGKPEDGGDATPAKPEESPKPDAAVKTWEYRGKQYTLGQMAELGILDDVIQTARQFPTIQTKYQQLLEKGQPVPGQGTAPAVPQQPQGLTGDQILAAYTPVMEKSAEMGYIEPEAYQAFPKLVSTLMFHRDLLYDVRQAVAAILRTQAEKDGNSQRTEFMARLDGLCTKVSGHGEHFALINDETVRKGFYEYLATLSIPVEEVNEDLIKRQWIAYNSDAVLEAVRQTATERKVKDEEKRRNAKGEGAGTRPAAPGPPIKTSPDRELINSFLEGSFSTGG